MFLIGSYIRILHRVEYSLSFCTHPSFYSIVCFLRAEAREKSLQKLRGGRENCFEGVRKCYKVGIGKPV